LFDQAQRVSESVTNTYDKERALQVLAEALAQAGTAAKNTTLIEQARKVAESITDPNDKASALQNLAETLARSGDTKQAAALLEQAREVLESITGRNASVLQKVAGELAALGHIRSARQFAETG
jgi:tetratricopeptide (TPR) repeat protein